ncbi:hypothetical protein SUGI_1453390 [Cryptomeria japonica]|uniref:Uncharacterized protein n=1 Tax=Cryptomeria japonica TaxID=3369 RepID=A0AAD3NSM1_CRYJA|nr:hypothetical protein SUGI_0236400 [Cryptomeria japonica]GLJ58398.1 hypothetical protein SUGI_1446000 [Cryptomeria japonica]GLJ58505.1 hypothetical protein SUGI_1453390 [Cryptomeria japonica]
MLSRFELYDNAVVLIDCEEETKLGFGAKLARQLQNIENRWDILTDYWVALLINISFYNKSTFHAELLTAGGEFLIHVWVLLDHIGC